MKIFFRYCLRRYSVSLVFFQSQPRLIVTMGDTIPITTAAITTDIAIKGITTSISIAGTTIGIGAGL